MYRIAIPVILAASVSVPAAAEVQVVASGPIVEMSVTQSVSADPDIAIVSAGVTTQAQTAVAAMQENAAKMAAVIDRIESLGVARDDIQTSGINLSPMYDYNQQTRMQVFQGYQVSNRVNLTVRDIDRTGSMLDALVSAGATDISGISWSIDDPIPARNQARETALRSAQAQAMAYATGAGFTGVRLLQISENSYASPPPPMPAAVQRLESADAMTPVRPGQVDVSMTVNVTYEMTR